MEQIGISVVIPVYNAEKFLEDTLCSVLSQTWPVFEVILIDDASTDQTAQIAMFYQGKDSRIRYYLNPENAGVSYSRSRGISLASYRWIAFLDSDDLWREDKLEQQVKLITTHPGIRLCYTGSSYFTNNREKAVYVPVPETVTLKQLLRKNIIPCSSVLIDKECFQEFSMKHDDAHEDYLLWLNLLRRGNAVRGIDKPLLTYRLHRDSKSGNKRKCALMTYKTYRYFGLNLLTAAAYMAVYCVKSIEKYSRAYAKMKGLSANKGAPIA